MNRAVARVLAVVVCVLPLAVAAQAPASAARPYEPVEHYADTEPVLFQIQECGLGIAVSGLGRGVFFAMPVKGSDGQAFYGHNTYTFTETWTTATGTALRQPARRADDRGVGHGRSAGETGRDSIEERLRGWQRRRQRGSRHAPLPPGFYFSAGRRCKQYPFGSLSTRLAVRAAKGGTRPRRRQFYEERARSPLDRGSEPRRRFGRRGRP